MKIEQAPAADDTLPRPTLARPAAQPGRPRPVSGWSRRAGCSGLAALLGMLLSMLASVKVGA